jgi:hypothetical protein
VDITFGEYLRGLITADFDLIADDRLNYRVAFVEAFRKRGIYPQDLDTLSVDTLRWQGVNLDAPPPQYRDIVDGLKKYADACFYISDRKTLFDETRKQREQLHGILKQSFKEAPKFANTLGLVDGPFEVHQLRRSIRIGPDGQHTPQIILALTQSREIKVEGDDEPRTFRGGSTLVVDLSRTTIDYAILKRVDSTSREARTTAFLTDALKDPLKALMVAPDRKEPFAGLHGLSGMIS